MNPVAIILAAGEGKQYGHSKALLEHEGGRSFLRSLALSFQRAGCRAIGVIGSEAEKVRGQHPELLLVECEGWRGGPMAAVKTGIAAALEEGADLILLHPVDMPSVRTNTLKGLLKFAEGKPGAVPAFEGAPGKPVVLSRATAEALVKDGHADLNATVAALKLPQWPTKDPGVVVNINSPEIYERLFGSPPKLAPPPKRRGKKSAEAAAE